MVLVALGLTIIFGLLDVINMSHGEFYAVGAFGTLALAATGLNFWVLIALVPMLVSGAPRTWEGLPRAAPVTWFPAGNTTTAVVDPAPDDDNGIAWLTRDHDVVYEVVRSEG